jgi:acetyl esterase/lipase
VSVAPLANLPDPARRKLAEIGPVWGTDIQRHRDLVLEIYRPLLAAAPKAGVEVTRGIAYGSHPRHILDVYRSGQAANAPVVLFVHGGAFVRGDKDVTDEVYANVCYYFARHGYLAVNVEYRLARSIPAAPRISPVRSPGRSAARATSAATPSASSSSAIPRVPRTSRPTRGIRTCRRGSTRR